MGVLDDIYYFEDGELSSSGIQGQIESMILIASAGGVSIMETPIGIGVPEGDLNYLSIETNLDDHEEKFPQFHKILIPFLKQSTGVLNIEGINILKAIGITDPTQPLVDLINNLKPQLEGIIPADLDVDSLLISKIPAIANLAAITSFVEFLTELVETDDLEDVDLEGLFNILEEIFPPEEEPAILQSAKDKIEELKADATGPLAQLKETALNLPLFSNLDIEPPSISEMFSIPSPLFSLEMLGFESLIPFEIPTMLFKTDPPPGIFGFLINFLEQMVIKIIEKIGELQIPTTAFTLPGYLADGVEGLINFIIDQFLGPIKDSLLNAWPDIEQYIVPASFFAALLLTIIKIVVVVVIGVLLGPGLIMFSAAKILELI